MKKLRIAVAAAVLAGAVALAGCSDSTDGRSAARGRDLSTFSGTLAQADEEWVLRTEEGAYVLHLGNSRFLESAGVELEEGDVVTVEGFVEGDEIAAVTLQTGGESYALRSEGGAPVWAGNGQGRNSAESLDGRGGEAACDEEGAQGPPEGTGRGREIAGSGEPERGSRRGAATEDGASGGAGRQRGRAGGEGKGGYGSGRSAAGANGSSRGQGGV